MSKLKALGVFGFIATAPADQTLSPGADFVSRFFAPAAGVAEDPVTGSAHCTLVPYWADRLAKTTLEARQVSRRGGAMRCVIDGDRVRLTGRAVCYLEGTITSDALPTSDKSGCRGQSLPRLPVASARRQRWICAPRTATRVPSSSRHVP